MQIECLFNSCKETCITQAQSMPTLDLPHYRPFDVICVNAENAYRMSVSQTDTIVRDYKMDSGSLSL